MKAYQNILFDLDGTLTDSKPGIFACLKYSLEYFGIEEKNNQKIRKMIGPPLLQSFKDMYGFSEEKARSAIIKYRERYTNIGIYENRVYDGIPELLDHLYKNGKKIILATSKPDIFARRVLDHFNLSKYFSFISAGDLEQKHSEKVDIIKNVFENLHIKPQFTVMVGDRKYDINGANTCGIDSVGVLYGYGDRAELTEAGATYIAENVSDLHNLMF